MNKRDFLVRSGGVAVWGGMPLSGAFAAASSDPMAFDAKPATDAPASADSVQMTSPSSLQDWQALQGSTFDVQTALGRPVQLTLTEVRRMEAIQPDLMSTQFTLTFTGPRGLPLSCGTHALRLTVHPSADRGDNITWVYLEPVQHGERIAYAAHFNLLAASTA